MEFNMLAMLQFSIGVGIVLTIGMWIIYFTLIRPAIRKQKLQNMGEISMGAQDLTEAEEIQILTSFRVLPKERKAMVIKLIEALK